MTGKTIDSNNTDGITGLPATVGAKFKKALMATTGIMVIDFMDFLWEAYDRAIPKGYTVLKVADTTTARSYLPQLTNLRIIVIQGWSRSQAESMWDEGVATTYGFIKWALRHGFRGQILVVSSVLEPWEADHLKAVAPKQVSVAEKGKFLTGAVSYLRDDVHASWLPVREDLWRSWEWHLNRPAADPKAALAEGPELALTWLESFDATIAQGDPRQAYYHFVQLGVYTGEGDCGCIDPLDAHLPWEQWFHDHHGLFNWAVRETLAEGGLVAQVRAQLEADLASPDQFIWDEGPFGQFVLKSYGERLRTFLQEDGPTAEWKGNYVAP